MSEQGETYRSRQRRIQARMGEEGLSALVVFGHSSYVALGTSTSGYVRYLTGWTSRFAPSMIVLPVEGDPTLIVPGAHDALFVAEAFPWIKRCLAESPRSYGTLARRILESNGVGRVGIVGLAEMPYPVFTDLREGRDEGSLVAADYLLDEARAVKDPDEIEKHREAARISDEMLSALVGKLRGFRGPAWKLLVDVEHAGRSLGAEVATCWLSMGNPADRPRDRIAENRRQVRDGDQVLVGTWVTYDGYWGHCLRMGSIGAPLPNYQRIYATVLAQHRAAASMLRAGVSTSQIQAEAERLAEQSLPGSVEYPARFRYGHFQGLDYGEFPSAAGLPQPRGWSQLPPAPSEGVVLRAGMVMELHTNLGTAGEGFGNIGDDYLILEEGAERLTRFPQDLFEV